jgi:hypothetical protein
VVQAADLADDAVRWWDDNKLLSWDDVTMGFLASLFGGMGKGGPFGNPGDLVMLMNQRSAAGQAASMAPSAPPVAPPVPRVRPVTAPTPVERPKTTGAKPASELPPINPYGKVPGPAASATGGASDESAGKI